MTASLPEIGVRLAAVALGLVVWFWTQRLIARKAMTGDGVGDRVHVWTARWNAWLHGHPRATDRLLVASSASIDALGVWLIGASVFGGTFRPFLGVLLLFALRQVCQGVCTMPIPRGMIWRDPGVPSLLVTYGTSNDLFFSGHTALCVLGAMELGRAGPPWVAAVAGCVAALQAGFVLVLRAHYSADVIAGALAAWGCDVLAASAAPAVDGWIASLV